MNQQVKDYSPLFYHIFVDNSCMQRLKPDVDIILDILQSVNNARPDSTFIKSLLQQYQERGGLSKKQLEGLHAKALKVPDIAPGKMATLEAIILKKHERFKSALPEIKPLYSKDENTGRLIESILAKFPQHKRVIYLKAKFDNNVPLSPAELTELGRFGRLVN